MISVLLYRMLSDYILLLLTFGKVVSAIYFNNQSIVFACKIYYVISYYILP